MGLCLACRVFVLLCAMEGRSVGYESFSSVISPYY